MKIFIGFTLFLLKKQVIYNDLIISFRPSIFFWKMQNIMSCILSKLYLSARLGKWFIRLPDVLSQQIILTDSVQTEIQ